MEVHHLVVGPLQVNCYILVCEETREGIVVDPGGNPDAIRRALTEHRVTPVAIVATHAHFDHILAVDALREARHLPFYLHSEDLPVLEHQRQVVQAWLGFDPGPMPCVDGPLVPGRPLRFGRQELEIAHTPGHSPGSVTLIDHAGRRAFVGDLVFAGSVGRTDLPGGDFETLLESIRRVILPLPDDYQLLPGHGPFTSVGVERVSNPFFGLQP